MMYKKKYKTMILLAMALLLMAPSAMQAQIYISEDVEEYNVPRLQRDEWTGLVVPMDGSDHEQYLPLGDGAFMLAGLGAAYVLLKKRRKEERS